MKLVGCTDAKTYASMCSICSYKPNGNACNHADKVKLYEGEPNQSCQLIGCQDGKEFFMCKDCLCKPDGERCVSIQEKKVYAKDYELLKQEGC